MSNINPALKQLEFLVGDWEMELSNASFLPDPKTVLKGPASFEKFEGGDFLILRQGIKNKDMWATWFIGHDETSPNYTVLYLDDKKSSRVYEMSFENGIWKIWRNAPKFFQRYEGKVSKDGKIIKAYWENSEDGKHWEHNFDLVYTRK